MIWIIPRNHVCKKSPVKIFCILLLLSDEWFANPAKHVEHKFSSKCILSRPILIDKENCKFVSNLWRFLKPAAGPGDENDTGLNWVSWHLEL